MSRHGTRGRAVAVMMALLMVLPAVGVHAGASPGDGVQLREADAYGGSWIDPFNDTSLLDAASCDHYNVTGGDLELNRSGTLRPYLVGLWLFDEGTGTKTADATPNGNNGTISGATWAQGRSGRALLFDGSDDHVSLSKSLQNQTDLTLEAWVNYTGGSSTGVIFMDATSDSGNDLVLDMSSSGIGIRADKNGSTMNYEPAKAVTGLSLGNDWHHIVWTMAPSTSKVYVDGVLKTTKTDSASNEGYHAKNPSIGRWWDEARSTNYFKGRIDMFAIYDRALDADVVKELYRHGVGFSTRGNVTSTRIDVPTGKGWDTLVINKTQSSGQYVNVTVIDASTGNAVPGLPTFTSNGEVDISGLDPVKYPSIRLNATLEGSGDSTPYLHYWGVSWKSKDTWRDTVFAGYRVGAKRNVDVVDGDVRLSKLDTVPSLVSWWKFDEGSGTTAYDFSPNHLDGTLKNGPKYVTGRSGQALEFDGKDDRVELAHDTKFNFTGKMSVVAWVNANSTTYELPVICKGTGSGGESFCLDIYNNAFRFFRRYNNGASYASASSSKISTGVWYHVVGVADGSNVLLYVNGTKITGAAYSGTYDTNTHEVTIGSRQSRGGAYDFNMKGMIDEVGLFSDALTSSKVKDLYNRGMAKYKASGSLSSKPVLPPHQKRFETLRINKTVPRNAYMNITLLDGRTGQAISGFKELTSSTIDLTTIDQRVHPSIIVRADPEANGTVTPILHDWSMTFIDLVDSDQDGAEDQFDAFPDNPFEFCDTDGDGLGDTCDPDADGDGTPDMRDAFPVDDREWADTDGDGVGDNSDKDDDDDGVPDSKDAFPKNPTEYLDADGDGIGDHMDPDDDGDGVPDDLEWRAELGTGLHNVSVLIGLLEESMHDDLQEMEGSLVASVSTMDSAFLAELASINATLASDIRGIVASVTAELDAMGVHISGDTDNLQAWLEQVVTALVVEMDEVNTSLAGRMGALEARNDGLARSIADELADVLAALDAFEANSSAGDSDLRERLGALSDAMSDTQGSTLAQLSALLDEAAVEVAECDATLAARLAGLAAKISAFRSTTGDDLAAIEAILEDLDRLDAILEDLQALDRSLADAEEELEASVQDTSEEQIDASGLNLMLLVAAMVLAGIVALLAFRKGREKRYY